MDPGRASSCRIVIRGGGEMGSGVAWRLRRCGFDVVITEVEHPLAVRRWVSFSEAIYEGSITVEGTTAHRVELPESTRIDELCRKGDIPILICPDPSEISALRSDVVVDAILAKRNTGTVQGMAKLVIGLGPGFVAGEDVDCVIETNRGSNLGRCIWSGSAEANTGLPGEVGGETVKRVLRAPVAGIVHQARDIGDILRAGEVVAYVDGSEVRSQLDGIVRGMLRDQTPVDQGVKIGDIDPRADIELCRRISDKALAIGGGVLEAVMTCKDGNYVPALSNCHPEERSDEGSAVRPRARRALTADPSSLQFRPVWGRRKARSSG
ncbi:MAG: EF2563 family selenium-dependent molybdenum hydroxylase system protein [candidate division Zixibacteria bacterium]|nr:EF2563 family selenium-dependent molybdenum hydroxylase system protein [candidate division Zixibacteria bacterium]